MKVLIVDDEPAARRGLRRQLSELPDVTCVGEFGGRDDAVDAIVTQQPDVVLLDIQLGRANAFEIIEDIGADAMPLVVFVTAYDRHALRAFEVHALDYVLKPVDPERLQEALARAASLLALKRGGALADRLEGLLSQRPGTSEADSSAATRRFVVRDAGRLVLIEPDRIDWFESAGNYLRVHSEGRVHVMRSTMDKVAMRLAANASFVRIRRSAIVNIRAVAALERYDRWSYVVHLRTGARIISSRHYRHVMRALTRPE